LLLSTPTVYYSTSINKRVELLTTTIMDASSFIKSGTPRKRQRHHGALGVASLWLTKMIRLLVALLSLSAAFRPPSYCHAAHSRPARRAVVRNINPQQRYDRSINTFDPNGRLLQVEYAAAAASRGDTGVASVLLGNCLYIVITRTTTTNDSDDKNNLHHSLQSQQSAQSIVHRLDDHILLVTTGLHGDALWAATRLRRACQEHLLQHGQPISISQLARGTARELQHARRGRPLGCEFILAGMADNNGMIPVEEDAEDNGQQPPFESPLQLLRCGPGGALEDCRYCAVGGVGQEQQSQPQQVLKRLQQLVESYDHSDTDASSTTDDTPPSKLGILQQLAQVHMAGSDGGSLLQPARRWFRQQPSSSRRKTVTLWTLEPDNERRGHVKMACHDWGVVS